MTCRYMKPNHASYKPRRILFFDTETLPCVDLQNSNIVYQPFRLGVGIYGRYKDGELTHRKERAFETVQEFWDFVAECQSPRDTLWIVAHNLFFDLRAVLFDERFEQSEYVVDVPRSKRIDSKTGKPKLAGKPLASLDSPPRILGMRHCASGARCVCVDTFNWFKSSLAELGRMVGLSKLEMPDYENNNWEWFGYCRRDTEILERAFCILLKWCEDNDCGVFRYSAAGQAMSAYRHRFMRHKIVIHTEPNVKALERESYFGGQSEVYRQGKYGGQFYHVDVTSLFPSVMLNGFVPRKLLRSEMRHSFLELQPGVDLRHSIAEVFLQTPNHRFPVRINERPVYPVGEYSCILAGPELCHAADSGIIRSWRRWAEYDCATIFHDYVDYFWNLRQKYQAEGNRAFEQFCKMLLNTLYGKFSQRLPIWEDVRDRVAAKPFHIWHEPCGKHNDLVKHRSIGWQIQREVGKRESPASFIAVSSFVTSLARERMRQLRETAGKQSVYYQAVDSLIVDQTGFDNLMAAGEIQPGVLGKLRLIDSAHSVEILGVGDYAVDANVRLVGRKPNAIIHADGSWTQSQFDGPGSLFKELTKRQFAVRSVTRKRMEPYISGVVSTGGFVEPLELGSKDN